MLCYIWLHEWLSPSKIQSRRASKRDFVREILHSMQTTVVFAVIGFVVLFTPVRNITQVYTNLADYPTWWLYTSVVLSLVIHDTYFYWMHRLLHHPALFKRIHLVHHQSVAPTPWASYSFNFAEAVLEGLVIFPIVFLIPMHRIAVLLFIFIGFAINVYGHLGYEILPKWFRQTLLFEILATSTYHNLHHAKFKGNYGLYFRIWDRWMGTENPDYVKEYDKIQERRFGI